MSNQLSGDKQNADKVIQYVPGNPAPTDPKAQIPDSALGPYDKNVKDKYVSLGKGGVIELGFPQAFSNSGNSDSDLQIYEVGPDVEDTFVEIRPTTQTLPLLDPAKDADKDGFFEVGKVPGGTSLIDIDAFFPGFNPDQLTFDAVQLTDDPNEGATKGGTVGADIDAVEVVTKDTDYDIVLDLSDPSVASNTKLQDLIQKAADFWEGIITKNIPFVNDTEVGFIDDLKIKVTINPNHDLNSLAIKSLANTGNYRLRDPLTGLTSIDIDPLTGKPLSSFDHLPYYAEIIINPDTLAKRPYYVLQTLQHEIGHAIGFNSAVLEAKQLIKELDPSTRVTFTDSKTGTSTTLASYGFTGTKALDEYHKLGGPTSHKSVPLEDIEVDPTTKKPIKSPGHWKESVFPDSNDLTFDELLVKSFKGDELMSVETPDTQDAYVSKVTLGAFEDLGFNVDMTQATEELKVFTGSLWWSGGNPLFDIPY
jgi:hypothetical protein